MSHYVKAKEMLGRTIIDDVAMICLAIVSVILLMIEMNSTLTTSQLIALTVADILIALVFLVEWAIRYKEAPVKSVFVKKYWWELLASIPIPSTFVQALRALRILRLLRIIRLAARVKSITEFSETLSKHAYVIQIFVVFMSITFIASVVFDTFERGANPNLHNSWDSYWWSIATATTIAYGDIYPVTTAGRITAICIAMFGLGALGLLTAKIATTIIKEKTLN